MELHLIGHTERYAVEQLLLSLFPRQPEGQCVSTLFRGKTWLTASTAITLDGKCHKGIRRLRLSEETVRLRRRILQQSVYLAALPFLPAVPQWGALAGVRPTKLVTKHLLEGGTPRSADRLLERVYYVQPTRRSLALDCAASTVEAVKRLEPEDLSVYIGIPFCPTRCTYCSFVSRSIGAKTDLLEPYLQALLREIALTGELLESSGRSVRTIYIGGGTPTTLTADQLARLMQGIRDAFDLTRCVEFTVEGGRPDTLSPEKLTLLRQYGADRVSINPQSMIDGVLRACGRPHTAQDVRRAFGWARDAGFTDINMDLIAGLPTDSAAGFRQSLSEVLALSPSNVTVHTLALKKGADLFESHAGLPPESEVAGMVGFAEEALRGQSYRPYYLYRQKYMSGSFENVGWSRDGRDCLYNICMMEELHTILSLGGGGMTKVNLPGGKLERLPNPKFPEQYLQQLPRILEEKRALLARMKGNV